MKLRAILTLSVVVPLITGCAALPDLSDLPWASPVVGSGNVVTREFDLSGFDRVEVGGAFVVDIAQGDDFSVVVRIDENLEQYLRVQAAGGTLQIGFASTVFPLGTATREVEITMPELTRLELSGATQGTVSGFESTESLSVEVTGASRLHGDIQAGDAGFEVSGASTVELSGSGEALTLNASGASTADLSDFAVSDASVEASGASTARVNATGRLDAEASGASRIVYLGNPTLGAIESSGASTIEAG